MRYACLVCVLDLSFEASCELGTAFTMSPHSGKQQPRTHEMSEQAHAFRKSAWEAGLSSRPDWTSDCYSLQASGVGPPSSAPSRNASQHSASSPYWALPLSCPLLPGASPFTTALEAPTSHSERKEKSMRPMMRSPQHLLSPWSEAGFLRPGEVPRGRLLRTVWLESGDKAKAV